MTREGVYDAMGSSSHWDLPDLEFGKLKKALSKGVWTIEVSGGAVILSNDKEIIFVPVSRLVYFKGARKK